MPIKLYDTQDAIPEALRSSAIETKDGKFAVEEVDPSLGDAGKRALDEERAARKREADARKAAERERDELKRAREAEEKGLTKDQIAALRAEDEERRKAEIAPKDARIAELEAKIRKGEQKDALLAAGVMPTRLDKALLLLQPHIGEDGVVLDKQGKPTTNSLEQFLVGAFKEDNSFVFAGSGASGSGAEGSSGKGSPPGQSVNTKAIDEKRPTVAGNF